MKITKYLYSCWLLHCGFDILLQKIQLRMQSRIWISPPTIQVHTCQRRPCIANNNAIWINHRYQFNNIVVQQFIIIPIILCQFVYDVSHDYTSMSFRSMQSCLNINNLLLLMLNWPRFPALGQCYLIDVKTTHALSQYLLPIKQILIWNLKIICLLNFNGLTLLLAQFQIITNEQILNLLRFILIL